MESTLSSLGGSLRNRVSNAGRGERSLFPGEIIRLNGDRRGLHIVCRTGALWITQTDDEKDHVLQAGETFAVTRPGLVLVQSLGQGLVQVIRPATRIGAQNGRERDLSSQPSSVTLG
jgi:Protein of unknown function (DUF2917)